MADIGSPSPKLETSIKLDHKGKKSDVKINIEGKRKGKDKDLYANGKGKGITGSAIFGDLGSNVSIIQILTLVVSLLALIGVGVLLRKNKHW